MRQGQGRVAELARSCDPGSEIVENFGRKWEGARERDRERKKKERNRARERVSLSFSFLSLTLALLLSFSQEREREREIFLFSSHRYSFSLADFWSLLLLMPIIKIFYYIWLTELGRETKNSQKDCSCESSAQDSLFTAFVARVTKILIYAFGENDSVNSGSEKVRKFCCPGQGRYNKFARLHFCYLCARQLQLCLEFHLLVLSYGLMGRDFVKTGVRPVSRTDNSFRGSVDS